MITFIINKKNKKAKESILINNFINYKYKIIEFKNINEINFENIKTEFFCIIKNHSYFNSVILDELNLNINNKIILFPEIYEKNNNYLYLNFNNDFFLEEYFKYTSSFLINTKFFLKNINTNINEFILNNKQHIFINKDFDFLIFNNRGKNLNEN